MFYVVIADFSDELQKVKILGNYTDLPQFHCLHHAVKWVNYPRSSELSLASCNICGLRVPYSAVERLRTIAEQQSGSKLYMRLERCPNGSLMRSIWPNKDGEFFVKCRFACCKGETKKEIALEEMVTCTLKPGDRTLTDFELFRLSDNKTDLDSLFNDLNASSTTVEADKPKKQTTKPAAKTQAPAKRPTSLGLFAGVTKKVPIGKKPQAKAVINAEPPFLVEDDDLPDI